MIRLFSRGIIFWSGRIRDESIIKTFHVLILGTASRYRTYCFSLSALNRSELKALKHAIPCDIQFVYKKTNKSINR